MDITVTQVLEYLISDVLSVVVSPPPQISCSCPSSLASLTGGNTGSGHNEMLFC